MMVNKSVRHAFEVICFIMRHGMRSHHRFSFQNYPKEELNEEGMTLMLVSVTEEPATEHPTESNISSATLTWRK